MACFSQVDKPPVASLCDHCGAGAFAQIRDVKGGHNVSSHVPLSMAFLQMLTGSARVLHHPDIAGPGWASQRSFKRAVPAPHRTPRPKPSLVAMAAVDRTRGGALELQAEQGMKLLKATELWGPIWEAFRMLCN